LDHLKSFDCSLETIRDVRQWIADSLVSERIPDGVIADMLLAASEAVTNSIVHGYEQTLRGTVDCTLRISGDAVTLIVRDYGSGLDEKTYMRPDTSVPHEGGYGVYLIHSLMDEVTLSLPGQGTEWTMTKRINSKEAH